MLPISGPVEIYAQLRAALDKAAFLAELPGHAVLIRLDERGGDDEPAPWAFHGSGLPLPVDVPSSDEDVWLDRELTPAPVDASDSTLTGPTFSLSIPAARGRATLLVIPKKPESSVGRDATCDVVVDERSVSKKHARIARSTSGTAAFSVIDEGSANGVSVNGKPVAKRGKAAIKSGDVIDLGDVALLFLDANELYDGLPRIVSN